MRQDAVGLFWDDTPPPKAPKTEQLKRVPPSPTWLASDYLPGLQEARLFPVRQFTDLELAQASLNKEELLYDIEVYGNYFLAAFMSVQSGFVTYVEMYPGKQLDIRKLIWLMSNFTLIGFNSEHYDKIMCFFAANGCSTEQIKWASDKIIVEELRGSDVLREAKVKGFHFDHIDLIEIAPLRASLKSYAGRMHCKKMQDLPFHPSTILSDDQIAITRWYCINDLTNTFDLRQTLRQHIDLRVQLSNEYKIDLRSKSDAQIAEAVIGAELTKILGKRPQRPKIEIGTSYRYNIPAFLKYQTPKMNWALDIIRRAKFVVDHTGSIALPEEIATLELNLGNSVYRMGVGGLHSSESCAAHYSNDNHILIDKDVTSYYPFIILNQALAPAHLGQAWLRVFRTIVNRRVQAKANAKACKKQGDTVGAAYWQVIADSLKIVVNGAFGKLGSKWSILYAPDLLIQTTVTGQLSLLMYIERLELAGIPVVSANTDGIVMKVPRHLRATFDAITKQWEQDTQFETEETIYKALYSRDVNNYIAVKEDGKTKNKGAYSNPWSANDNLADRLHKNPTNTICVEAIEALLTKGTPLEQTIRGCTDVTKFVSVRSVRGGAVKVWDHTLPYHNSKEQLVTQAGFVEVAAGSWAMDESYAGPDIRYAKTLDKAYELACDKLKIPGQAEYLGKSIRWYYGKDVKGEIVYATNGNKVPRSDGAVPLMYMDGSLPDNIDYEWYLDECQNMLEKIGAREAA